MNDAPSSSIPAAPDAAAAIDGREFRDCIARAPSGVHIVTTAGPAGRSGFTATAVASVSDAPPTILVCLNRKSPQNELIRANACFSVNLLPNYETGLADVFAGRTGLHLAERFAHGRWSALKTGAPVLENAVMALDCRLVRADDIGSHTVFYGLVVAAKVTPVATDGSREILIYHDRHYAEA